jgi:hypothetical protein
MGRIGHEYEDNRRWLVNEHKSAGGKLTPVHSSPPSSYPRLVCFPAIQDSDLLRVFINLEPDLARTKDIEIFRTHVWHAISTVILPETENAGL